MRNATILWLLWLVVVLPTVLLGTLAARTVKTRETMLRQEYAERAGESLVRISNQIRSSLEEASRTVALSIGQTIDRDRAYANLARAANQLNDQLDMAASIFVFMSPWGFIYPAGNDHNDQQPNQEPDVVDAFNRAVIEGRPAARGPVGFRYGSATYMLTAIAGRQDLYAGFEIDENAVLAVADTLLADLRDRHFRTTIEQYPYTSVRPAPLADRGPVTVTDSLDMGGVTIVPTGITTIWQSMEDGSTLASMNLYPPLDHIQVSISHPGVANVTSIQFWNRASQIGILLLGIIICGGTAVILRGAVRMTHESKRRSELVAGMSHDLKTPVTAMRMLADGLSSGRITEAEKQSHFLHRLTRECDRLGDIVDRILFFLRHDSETVRFADNQIDMHALIDHCASIFRERLGERVELVVTESTELPAVRGDADALAKVIGNLLDNAYKYGVTATDRFIGLDMTPARHRGRPAVQIKISDHGPGIPAGEQHRVFERFYRIPAPAYSHVGGIGLGLALCREIIRAHHGKIAIDSKPGHGCTFIITIPATNKTPTGA